MSSEDQAKAKANKDMGMDPLMALSWGELVLGIPKRLVALVNKWLGGEMSLRIIGFAAATWLVFEGKIADYIWVITVIVLIFGKQGLDTLKDLKR